MKRSVIVAMACVVTLCVTGCIMPKEFTAKLDVTKDGSYEFVYDGTVVYVPMLVEAERGAMNKADEKELSEQIVAEFAKDKNTSNVSYLGEAVFKVTYKANGNINEEPLLMGVDDMPIFTFDTSPDGESAVFEFMPSADEIVASDEFPASSRQFKGTIVVTTELPVVSNTGNPEKAVLADAYTWKMDGMQAEMPTMTFSIQ